MPAIWKTSVWSLGWEDTLEKGKAYSSILSWRIPWAVPSLGSQRVRHDWVTFTLGFPSSSDICLQCKRPGFDPWVGKIPWRRKWQPTLVFLPGEFQGQRNLVGYSPRGREELDTTETLTHKHTVSVCCLEMTWRHLTTDFAYQKNICVAGLVANSGCF